MFSKRTFGARNYGPKGGLLPRAAKKKATKAKQLSPAAKKDRRERLRKALRKEKEAREMRFLQWKAKKKQPSPA